MLRAAAAQAGETARAGRRHRRRGDAARRARTRRRAKPTPRAAGFGEAIGRYEALAVTEKDEPHWRAVLSDAWALAAEADYVRGAPDAARERDGQGAASAAAPGGEASARKLGARGHVARCARRCARRSATAQAAAESLQQARALAETIDARRRTRKRRRASWSTRCSIKPITRLRTGELNRAREAADTARMQAEAFAPNGRDALLGLARPAACWDRLGEVARAARRAAQAQDAIRARCRVAAHGARREPASASVARAAWRRRCSS